MIILMMISFYSLEIYVFLSRFLCCSKNLSICKAVRKGTIILLIIAKKNYYSPNEARTFYDFFKVLHGDEEPVDDIDDD